jgi:hypothetical protein
MTSGTPVDRQWVLVTQKGDFVIDWGDNTFLDIYSGDFIDIKEGDISHHPSDKELDWLMHINRVAGYDSKVVYFYNLPERPQKMID